MLTVQGCQRQRTRPKKGFPYKCLLLPGAQVTLEMPGYIFEFGVVLRLGPDLDEFRRKRDAFLASCCDLGALTVASQIPTQLASASLRAPENEGQKYMYWSESKLGRGAQGAVRQSAPSAGLGSLRGKARPRTQRVKHRVRSPVPELETGDGDTAISQTPTHRRVRGLVRRRQWPLESRHGLLPPRQSQRHDMGCSNPFPTPPCRSGRLMLKTVNNAEKGKRGKGVRQQNPCQDLRKSGVKASDPRPLPLSWSL